MSNPRRHSDSVNLNTSHGNRHQTSISYNGKSSYPYLLNFINDLSTFVPNDTVQNRLRIVTFCCRQISCRLYNQTGVKSELVSINVQNFQRDFQLYQQSNNAQRQSMVVLNAYQSVVTRRALTRIYSVFQLHPLSPYMPLVDVG